MSLKHILARPEIVDGITLHPVLVEDYDDFSECSRFLYLSKDAFGETPLTLMDLVLGVYEQLGETVESYLTKICRTFEIITKCSVGFIPGKDLSSFVIDEKYYISEVNYDTIRNIIMKQNLMFEPKKYKDPIVQEWADKVVAVRSKKQGHTTLEDMITTVKAYQGVSYEQISKQSIYQLYADFFRICKIVNFEQSSLFSTVSSEKITIEYFAQNINLFVEGDPYKDVFMDGGFLNQFNKF